jgi:hypothetical protein
MSVTKDPVEGNDAAVKSNGQLPKEIQSNWTTKTQTPPPKISLDTSSTMTNNGVDHTAEFIGDVDTDNTIPSQALLHKVADFPVLDQDGKSRPFKNLYSGPMVASRVLVIFVRHFFCGVSYAPPCYPSPVSLHLLRLFAELPSIPKSTFREYNDRLPSPAPRTNIHCSGWLWLSCIDPNVSRSHWLPVSNLRRPYEVPL